jgi:hypothetical protein
MPRATRISSTALVPCAAFSSFLHHCKAHGHASFQKQNPPNHSAARPVACLGPHRQRTAITRSSHKYSGTRALSALEALAVLLLDRPVRLCRSCKGSTPVSVSPIVLRHRSRSWSRGRLTDALRFWGLGRSHCKPVHAWDGSHQEPLSHP